MYWFGAFFGGFVVAYLLTAFVLRVVLRKFRDTLTGVFLSGAIALALLTLFAGFGLQDGRPSPVFFEAFANYFGPVLLVLVIELALLTRRVRQS